MKIAIITFLYWRDAHRAVQLHKNIPKHYKSTLGIEFETQKFWIVSSQDKDLAKLAPQDTKVIVYDFNRGSSLNGLECIIAQCDIYKRTLNEFDAIIKLDADSILFDCSIYFEGFARDMDVICSPRHKNERWEFCFNGCCYAFAKSMKGAFEINNIPKAIEGTDFLPEDICIYRLIKNSFPNFRMLPLNKSKWYMSIQPYTDFDCTGAHFGYRSNESIEKIIRKICENRKNRGLNAEISFSKAEADKFIASQVEIAKNRKIAPFLDLYDDSGKDLRKSHPLAGSILQGYTPQGEPIFSPPQQSVHRADLLPFHPSNAKFYQQQR